MKKTLGVLVFLGIFAWLPARAEEMQVMCFLDGGCFNRNEELVYTCFPDQTCIGRDDKIYKREDIAFNPNPKPLAAEEVAGLTGSTNQAEEPTQQPTNPQPQANPISDQANDTTAPQLTNGIPTELAGYNISISPDANEPVSAKIWLYEADELIAKFKTIYPNINTANGDAVSEFFKNRVNSNDPKIITFTDNNFSRNKVFRIQSYVKEKTYYWAGYEIKDAAGNATSQFNLGVQIHCYTNTCKY